MDVFKICEVEQRKDVKVYKDTNTKFFSWKDMMLKVPNKSGQNRVEAYFWTK